MICLEIHNCVDRNPYRLKLHILSAIDRSHPHLKFIWTGTLDVPGLFEEGIQ